jgi:hypothetical protein
VSSGAPVERNHRGMSARGDNPLHHAGADAEFRGHADQRFNLGGGAFIRASRSVIISAVV